MSENSFQTDISSIDGDCVNRLYIFFIIISRIKVRIAKSLKTVGDDLVNEKKSREKCMVGATN